MAAPKVVVFIPGILGSELVHKGRVVWPGTVGEYVRGYDRMPQLLDEETVVGGVIRRYGPLQQYQPLIDDFHECGFEEVGSPATLRLFPYDWRRDNAQAATGLAALLEDVVSQHGVEVTVALVAHSMGGLVARHYLESDVYTERPAFRTVRQLITLGTPHAGAPLALAAATGKIGRLFLGARQVRELAMRPEYPALYQLLPEARNPFAWNLDVSEDFAPLDIYDAHVASRLELSNENLESARRFRSTLSLARRPEHVRYFAFYGTEVETITAVGLLPWKDGYRVDLLTAKRGGDETVPGWSALLDGVQGYAVGGEHGTIFRDHLLRRFLAGLLGRKGVLAAGAPTMVMLVPQKVVPPDGTLAIQLSLITPVAALHGRIQFRRVPTDEQGHEGEPIPFGSPYEVSYAGGDVSRLELQLKAPAYAGFYQAEFVPGGDDTAVASDRFIVQA